MLFISINRVIGTSKTFGRKSIKEIYNFYEVLKHALHVLRQLKQYRVKKNMEKAVVLSCKDFLRKNNRKTNIFLLEQTAQTMRVLEHYYCRCYFMFSKF